jgi:hypothetical protein
MRKSRDMGAQAVKFTEALLKGTPDRERIALRVLSDKVRELV